MIRSFLSLVCCAALFSVAGCVAPKPLPPKPPTPGPVQKQSYWQGDGVTGNPSILISLSEQRAHFFKGDKEVGQAVISSGKKGFETPTGDFKVIQKDRNHVSNLYGEFVDEAGTVVKRNVDVSKEHAPEGASFQGAKMPFFLRFHDGAGMHAGRLPGYAGIAWLRAVCHVFMAEHFFENALLGTPVRVTGDAPTGGDGEKARPKSRTPTRSRPRPSRPRP